MTEPPLPSVLAMLLCDQVIVDESSKKKSLIGVFDRLNALNFPALLNCAIYAKLADAEGRYTLRLRVVSLSDESLLGEIVFGGNVPTQLEPSEFGVQLMGIPIPAPGKYEFQMYANDVYLGRVTLTALQVEPGSLSWP
jgi:hypothetical protein